MPDRSRPNRSRRARAWPVGHALAVFWGVCALAWLAPAEATPAAGGAAEVRVGFDGLVKIGVPVPLEIVLPPLPLTGRALLIVDAPALGPAVGPVVTSTTVPFETVADAARAFELPVIIRDPRRPLTVRVRVQDREALRAAVPISPPQVSGRIVVVISDEPAGISAFRRLPGRVAAAYLPGARLPRRWQEYAAADLVVVRDLDAGSVDDAQRDALLTWVRLGGHLLVVARPSARVPAFLAPVLPGALGEARTVTSLAPLAARYGGAFPEGRYRVTEIVPRAGVRRVSVEGVPVIASGAAGTGQAAMWGFDPWDAAFAEWDGRLKLWEETLGEEVVPAIDPEAIGDRLVVDTWLDPGVHAAIAGAILLYVLAVLVFLRRRATIAGVLGSLAVALAGIGGFAALAGIAHDRSTVLTQATVLEASSGTGLARATAVAAVAVPYGGRFRIAVPRKMVAGPVTSASDLGITLGSAGTVLAGAMRPAEAARVLQAIGAVPFPGSGWMSADGRHLTVDLGSARARQVQLRWRGRIYPVGDLPAGRSAPPLDPGQWADAADARTLPDVEGAVLAGIFQPPSGDAILGTTTPVLVGELDGSAPVFTIEGAGTPGPHMTFLLMPLDLR